MPFDYFEIGVELENQNNIDYVIRMVKKELLANVEENIKVKTSISDKDNRIYVDVYVHPPVVRREIFVETIITV